MKTIFNDNFYGATISNYGRENGYVDYKALKDSFNAVMCNSILSVCADDWEQIHGFIDNSEKIEELDNKKDELEEIQSNINDMLEKLDDVENAIYDFNEAIKYKDFEYEDADEVTHDFDIDEAVTELESLDLWEIRENLESYDSEIAEEIERLEAEKEQLENEAVSLENAEIFQYFIIDGNGADILQHWTNEIVFYNSELDMYVWGITHFGTAWDYVLTDIKCETFEEADAREKAEAPLKDYDAIFDAYLTEKEATDKRIEMIETLSRLRKEKDTYTVSEAVVALVDMNNDKVCNAYNEAMNTFVELEDIEPYEEETLNSVEDFDDVEYFKQKRSNEGWNIDRINEYLRLHNRDFKQGDVVVSNSNVPTANMSELSFDCPTQAIVCGVGETEHSADGEYKLMIVNGLSDDGNYSLKFSRYYGKEKLVDVACFDGLMSLDGELIETNSINW